MKISAFNTAGSYNSKPKSKIAFRADREWGEPSIDENNTFDARLERITAEKRKDEAVEAGFQMIYPAIVFASIIGAGILGINSCNHNTKKSNEISTNDLKQNISYVIDSMDVNHSDSISMEEAQNLSNEILENYK